MLTEKTTEQLKEEATQIQEELRKRSAEERRKASEGLVGKCFVYRNCYSCPKGPDDYWNLYSRVTGLDARGTPTGVTMEDDGQGFICVNQGCLTELTQEIPQHEWDAAVRTHLARIESLLTGDGV